MKILISGGNGKLAKEIIKANISHDIIALSRDDMDVNDIDEVFENICIHEPDVFIHAGAMTRPMGKHAEDPIQSINSNIIGTANVVNSCLLFNGDTEKNIKLIYISTDYVYPGTNVNYKEEDPLLPVNEYAWSKLGGECSVKLYNNHLIIRTSMIEYPFPHKKAFTDSYKSCLYQNEVAKILLKLINKNIFGTINIGGKRQSIYDFVKNNNNTIGKISIYDINESISKDSSLNIGKLESILKERKLT